MADVWSSRRLIYRGVDDGDEDFFFHLLNNPLTTLNSAHFLPRVWSKKSAKELRELMQSDTNIGAAIICLPPGGQDAATYFDTTRKQKDDEKSQLTPIGFVSLDVGPAKVQHHRHAECGMNMLPEYRGQGYGTEAFEWMLRFAFQRANLHRVTLGVFSWNKAAIRLYERLGFVREGVRREHLFLDGQYHDEVDMANLDREWRARYGKIEGLQ